MKKLSGGILSIMVRCNYVIKDQFISFKKQVSVKFSYERDETEENYSFNFFF